jgi:hypothetical protein
MGFINWQNLKKYIRRGTDAEVARIGHVNAVYDALAGGAGGGVNEISINGEGPYKGSVQIYSDRYSSINENYKVTSTYIDDSTVNLGIAVPYHEVIGTIQLAVNNGTAKPALGINVNTALADVETPAEWDCNITEPSSGNFHITLSMSNFVQDYYRNGMITYAVNASNIYSLSMQAYELLPVTGYSSGSIDLVLSDYVVQTGVVKRTKQSLLTNTAVEFYFHLILPIYNA